MSHECSIFHKSLAEKISTKRGERYKEVVCGLDDTDIHLFTCPGYSDIVNGQFDYYSFWDIDTLEDIEKLKMLAKIVLLLLERMKHIQKFDN